MTSPAESKTPRFDAALYVILSDLAPHTRTCQWTGRHPHCEGEFPITAEDIEFLTMLRVPPPNFCPTCRRMRRFVHLSVLRLFQRSCEAPGHDESMISIYPPECPFPVYDYQYFTGDEFDPFTFGRDYTGGSPLAMLLELRHQFPMPSFLNRDPSSINSDYSNGGRNLKNGYYVTSCYDVEDAWYCTLLRKSQLIMDSHQIDGSELVYEGVSSDRVYNSSFVYFSSNCAESMFLFDCINTTNCFGGVNLRNKQYCVFNEQRTKEEYEQFIASLYPLSRNNLEDYKAKFWQLVKQQPMNASRIIGSQNVTGFKIKHSRDLFDVGDAENAEHIRHADLALAHKDSMDFFASGGNSSRVYGVTNVGSQSNNVRFSVSSKFISDSEFVFNSKNLSNCFMCFGLQNKSYCILNKQYEPDEYFARVDAIKTEMLGRGEYADGLGLEFSGQAYNMSQVQFVFPLDDDTIRALGGFVAAIPEPNVAGLDLIVASDVPQTIEDTSDDILQSALQCEVTGRPFRIEPSELAFYQKMRLPLPTKHPAVRIEQRLQLAPEGRQFATTCHNCSRDITSGFNPAEGYLLYCPDCYREIVT